MEKSKKSNLDLSTNQEPATLRFLVVAFILLAIVQILVYRHMWEVLPSADDFTEPMIDIMRARYEGVISIFRGSVVDACRPLISFLAYMIALGEDDKYEIYHRIHLFTMVVFLFLGFVCFLWIRELKMNRIAACFAGMVFFLHPILAGPAGGLDGYGRWTVLSLSWLGAYFTLKYVNKSFIKAVIFTSICFLIGIFCMEYAIMTIPLSLVVILTQADKEKWKKSVLMLIPLLIIFLIYFYFRTYIFLRMESGKEFISLNPVVWIKNFLMMSGSLLYVGDITSIMINKSPLNLAVCAISALVTFSVILAGIFKVFRTTETDTGNKSSIKFILILFFISYFPVVLLSHVSEWYVSALMIPYAILVGYALSGLAGQRKFVPYPLLIIFLVYLIVCCWTIRTKVDDLREVGIRAQNQINQILSFIPPDAHDMNIAMVFTPPALNPSVLYSVFARDDASIIHWQHGLFLMNWYFPGKNIDLDHELVHEISEVDFTKYDMILLWDFNTKTFSKLK